ncbi:hypothetical protein SAMN04488109_3172 [Chryseolinea serpens]|uniref:Uncharacterized protein n=1 Tax=Chryseolinea serpens TaxID=947013 RepID=A0A1M5R4C2_9BACT|nr:hypothetical protein [Chryseolinea serpens]SHH20880.1 hypothetical protein SAMN04488109_3172 [Chryseolinea serpens]
MTSGSSVGNKTILIEYQNRYRHSAEQLTVTVNQQKFIDLAILSQLSKHDYYL